MKPRKGRNLSLCASRTHAGPRLQPPNLTARGTNSAPLRSLGLGHRTLLSPRDIGLSIIQPPVHPLQGLLRGLSLLAYLLPLSAVLLSLLFTTLAADTVSGLQSAEEPPYKNEGQGSLEALVLSAPGALPSHGNLL